MLNVSIVDKMLQLVWEIQCMSLVTEILREAVLKLEVAIQSNHVIVIIYSLWHTDTYVCTDANLPRVHTCSSV